MILLTLLYWYSEQKVSVRWNHLGSSDKFPVTCAMVESSPVIFTIYVNDLLEELKKDWRWMPLGSPFVGAICYADNNIIAPQQLLYAFCCDLTPLQVLITLFLTPINSA